MRILNKRYVALILMSFPFVVLGWFFTSWLSQQSAKATERPEIVIVDPPKEFNETATRLGFVIIQKNDHTDIDFTSYRVRIPKGFEIEAAKTFLRQQLPGLVLANLRAAAPNPVE